MNKTAIVLLVLLVSVFLVGCTSSQNGYATYNQQQQGQQQQGQQQPYVGGGCGVAPGADYEDTPVKTLDSADSSL